MQVNRPSTTTSDTATSHPGASDASPVGDADLSDFGAGAGLTVTEDVRRRQIIDATIATIADLGYAKTSFARIVERADLSSTRMVSYHFAGKADLVQATLGTVVDRQDTFVAQRLGEERDLGRLLLGQLTGEVAFLAAHPRESAALVEIGTHAATADDADVSAQVVYAIRFGRLERQLAQGIRHGVFRELDPKVMALVMRQAVDGVILRLRREPDLDPDACGRELTDLFDRAVRAD